MPKKPTDNPSCPSCQSTNTVKNGTRKNKKRAIKRYLCKDCNTSFTLQHKAQQHKTYNLNQILNSISNYNLGKALRKNNNQIPKSTIHNWITQLKTDLPFNRLRNKIKKQPTYNIIIKKQFFHHRQPFLYQYHSLKLNFARKFPGLITYLKSINKSLPKHIFNNSERISQASRNKTETPTKGGDEAGDAPSGVPSRTKCEAFWPSPAIGLVGVSKLKSNINLKEKQNYAVKLAKLAKEITNDNKKRHQIIENFMLINDTATIAAEIPVYITKNETKTANLTGHIDILQSRYHKLFILDYKPEPINKPQTIAQLTLYREALSKRANIPRSRIKLAFFNDKGYYELS
ncbi:PD-(D/E)XK nuclease family protein [Candidatus Woesearchaeota archaeon]|nr:PD-(D/E)XK nuclease family protein [Candidatus Woesearchaeota archaeon]